MQSLWLELQICWEWMREGKRGVAWLTGRKAREKGQIKSAGNEASGKWDGTVSNEMAQSTRSSFFRYCLLRLTSFLFLISQLHCLLKKWSLNYNSFAACSLSCKHFLWWRIMWLVNLSPFQLHPSKTVYFRACQLQSYNVSISRLDEYFSFSHTVLANLTWWLVM